MIAGDTDEGQAENENYLSNYLLYSAAVLPMPGAGCDLVLKSNNTQQH